MMIGVGLGITGGNDGTSPSLVLDFINGAFPLGLAFTRASTATHFDAAGALQTAAVDVPRIDYDPVTLAKRGLLIEGTRTNLFLNSATPATQSIAVTAQSYALSFRGTGSITLSGAHSAVLSGTGATAKTVLVFTPAAGTLTLTLSGSVTEPQLEVGNCATSYIATAGAAVSRNRDQVTLAPGAWFNADAGTFLVEWSDVNMSSGNTRLIGMDGNNMPLGFAALSAPNNATSLNTYNGVAPLTRASGLPDITKGARRAAVGYSAAGRSLSVNGLVSSDAGNLQEVPATITNFHLGHSSINSLHINGCLRSLRYWPRRLSDTELAALTA